MATKTRTKTSANGPWRVPSGHLLAIRPEMIETLRAADGTFVPVKPVASEDGSPLARGTGIRSELFDQGGMPVDDDEGLKGQNGIAVISAIGAVSQYDDIWHWVFGGFVLEDFVAALVAAEADPSISAIVLRIDSPGGDAHAILDASDCIAATNLVKPVIGWVPGEACSAGYGLLSAAGSIVVSQTAVLGSLGVQMTYEDWSEWEEKAGVRTLTFISSVSPEKNRDPATPEGAAAVQTLVDDWGELFIGAIAKNRGVSVDKAKSDFGQGGVLLGTKAVTAGLADRIGTLDDAIALAARLGSAKAAKNEQELTPAIPFNGLDPQGFRSALRSFVAETSPSSTSAVTRSTTGADAPGGPKMDEQAIRAAAAQAERERMTAIRKLDTSANRALCGAAIDAAYGDGTTTAGDLAITICAARDANDKVVAAARGKARAEDGAEARVEEDPENPPDYQQPTAEEVAAMRGAGGKPKGGGGGAAVAAKIDYTAVYAAVNGMGSVNLTEVVKKSEQQN